MKEITKKLLIRSGWNEGRCIDTSPIRKRYEEIKLEYPENVDDFLKEFGDLIIIPRDEKNFDISFNVISAIGCNIDAYYFKECLSEYSVKEEIYPIGMACRNNLLVLMTKTNKFYCFTDGLLLYLGGSVSEMFDCVVDECREAKEID